MVTRKTTLGGPLTLVDEGVFFLNGKVVRSDYPSSRPNEPVVPGLITINQMYVQYRIPARPRPLPIVMVHGSGHTGATFETTPDGREGWATYFARQRYPVYVVDHCGRGRSGFDPTAINRAKVTGDASVLPGLRLVTHEFVWAGSRIGPQLGQRHADSQMPPGDAFDHLMAQTQTTMEATLDGGGENTITALVALLERIGPAILLVHSQGTAYCLKVARTRPKLVRSVVVIEGDCTSIRRDSAPAPFDKAPLLVVWGDHSDGHPGLNGDGRREGCITAVDAIQKAGGTAEFMLLPKLRMKGNSHNMMMEKNSHRIADLILAWLEKNVGKKKKNRGQSRISR